MANNTPINWAYPFKLKTASSNPLEYISQMAKATAGFYPTGNNGLWHGGVHFDEGTATAFDQSSIACIADGEVIAYRVNEKYPITEYPKAPQLLKAPYSSSFVLVKHILQPPQPQSANANDSAASSTPAPSITFFSLYMHLQDWTGYQAKTELPKPAFWQPDSYVVNTQEQGLVVRASASRTSANLAVLASGSQVQVADTDGEFAKLISIISGSAHPAVEPDADCKMPGYISKKYLKAQSKPEELDTIVILAKPIPIKAGDLIGHLGTYQNHDGSAQPLLHLEAFSCDDVPGFISQSRAWASQLPAKDKTLLKVHKGASQLIKHRPDISTTKPPKLTDDGQPVGVDLLIPQAYLDSLPATHKLTVTTPASADLPEQTTNWWHLENLLADAQGNPISGWLAEQDLITTRHSPWEWQDFQFIEDTGTPLEKFAYNLNARGQLSADEQHNYRAQISKADGGPIVATARLYEIVDSNKDGVLTSDEIRVALSKPWQAQVLGQLIVKYESEWFWNAEKWNELDPMLALEGGQKNLVWEKEKQRIEKLSWWNNLAGKHGISVNGAAWHFHPSTPAFLPNSKTISRCKICDSDISITHELMERIKTTKTTEEFVNGFIESMNSLSNKYGIDSCSQIKHLLAQAKHETQGFSKFREPLYYSSYTAESLYAMAPTAINNGFTRKGITFKSNQEKMEYIKDNLLKNDAGYGNHCFGSNEYPENDYRGRGLLHLTHFVNYDECAKEIGKPISKNPTLVEKDIPIIVETGLWFWKQNNLKPLAENIQNSSDENVKLITKIINGGYKGLAERTQYKREIDVIFEELYKKCEQ